MKRSRETEKQFQALFGLSELPATFTDAVEQAKDILKTAKELLADHKRNAKLDSSRRNARLRAAAELTWLASLNACQAILLDRGSHPTGNVEDIDTAADIAQRAEEYAVVTAAHANVKQLHGDCFYRNNLAPSAVEKRLAVTAEAVRQLGKGGH